MTKPGFVFETPRAGASTFSRGELAGFTDIAAASMDEAWLVANTKAREAALSRAYDQIVREVYEATGEELTNPMTYGPREVFRDVLNTFSLYRGPSEYALEQHQDTLRGRFAADIQRLKEANPGKRFAETDPDQLARDIAAGAARNAENLRSRARGPLEGLGGSLAGGLAGSFGDPFQIATLPVGWGSKTILGAAVKEALANAAIQTALEPGTAAWADEIGVEYGLDAAAANILGAGIFGGALGGGGKATETALARVLARDPAARGAARQVQADAKAAALKPPGVTASDHQAAMGEALKAAAAPEIFLPPPRPDPVPAAAGVQLDGRDALQGGFQLDGLPAQTARFDVTTIRTDAGLMQYKGGGDAEGVTTRLQGIERWDPFAAGQIVVWERQDGTRIVADGHQRTGLARRLVAQGREQAIELDGFLLREADGWTAEKVRARAAKTNIQQGSGDVVDTARIFRDAPEIIDDSLPVTGDHMRNARALARLGDEAWGLVVNGRIDPSHAAVIGRYAPDPATHGAIARAMIEAEPRNQMQAQFIVREAIEAGFVVDRQESLFGDQFTARSLMRERMRLTDAVSKKLRDDARVFGLLEREAERIEAKGNQLARGENARIAVTSAQVDELLLRLATRKGPIGDRLTRLTHAIETGDMTRAQASAELADAMRAALERDGLDGLLRDPDAPPSSVPSPSVSSSTAASAIGRAGQDPTPDALDAASDELEAMLGDVGPEPAAAGADTRLSERPGDTPGDMEAKRADLKALLDAKADAEAIWATPLARELDAAGDGEPTLQRGQPIPEGRRYLVNGQETDLNGGMDYLLARYASAAGPDGPLAERRAVIVIGYPGAGKSTFIDRMAARARAAFIDADVAKTIVPEYEGGKGSGVVHNESSQLRMMATAALLQDGTNILYETVGWNPADLRKDVSRMTDAGYSVELVHVRVDPDEAVRRSWYRFLGTGRFITPSYARAIRGGVEKSAAELMDDPSVSAYMEIDYNGRKSQTSLIHRRDPPRRSDVAGGEGRDVGSGEGLGGQPQGWDLADEVDRIAGAAREAEALDGNVRRAEGFSRFFSSPDQIRDAAVEAFGEGADRLFDVADRAPPGHPNAQAWTNKATGRVTINAANILPEEVRGILLHEVGVHAGLEEMVGPGMFDQLLRLAEERALRGEGAWQGIADAVPGGTPEAHRAEEFLAYFVDRNADVIVSEDWWSRFAAAVRRWASKIFGAAVLTDEDVVELARGAVRGMIERRQGADAATEGDIRFSERDPAEADPPEERDDKTPDMFGTTPDANGNPSRDPYADVKRADAMRKVVRDGAKPGGSGVRAAIADALRAGELSEREADDLNAALDRYQRSRQSEGEASAEAAEAQAASDLDKALEAERARRRFLANLNRKVSRRLAKEMKAFRNGSGEHDIGEFLQAVLDYRGQGSGLSLSVEGHRRSIEAQALADMEAVLHHFRQTTGRVDAKGVTLRANRMDVDNFVKELFGEDTKDPQAKILAQAAAPVLDGLRQRRNRAGGATGKLENWGLPQGHDTLALRRFVDAQDKAGKDGKALLKRRLYDSLAIDRMRDLNSGQPMSKQEVWVALDHVVDTLLTDGWAHRKPSRVDGGGSLASQRIDQRFLIFKDAATWLDWQRDFGAGDPITAMIQHVEDMAKEIAAMEILGPNPDGTVTWLTQIAQAEAAKARLKQAALLPRRLRKPGADPEGYIRRKTDRAEAMWETYMGGVNMPVNRTLAAAGNAVRNVITASALGSAVVSAVPTDPIFQGWARYFAGSRQSHAVTQLARHVFDQGGRQARQMALILDHSLGTFNEQARFSGQFGRGGWSKILPSTVLAAQGLTAFTRVGRENFTMGLAADFGNAAGTAWGQLDPALRNSLYRYGIEAADWDAIRGAPLEPGGFLSARRIRDHAGENLADRYLHMLLQEAEYATPSGTLRSRSLMMTRARAGTFMGEALRSGKMFMAFAATLPFTWGYRLFHSWQADKFRGAAQAGAMLATLTVGGAIAIQLKALLAGKDPQDMTDPKFLQAAALQGGGLGIYGDFIFADLNRFDNSLGETMMGPVVAAVGDVRELTLGNINQAMAGEDANAASEISGYVARMLPGTGLWYMRLAYDRWIEDQLRAMTDPEADQAFRSRVQRLKAETGQGYWWKPGKVLPDRAPEVSEAPN